MFDQDCGLNAIRLIEMILIYTDSSYFTDHTDDLVATIKVSLNLYFVHFKLFNCILMYQYIVLLKLIKLDLNLSLIDLEFDRIMYYEIKNFI